MQLVRRIWKYFPQFLTLCIDMLQRQNFIKQLQILNLYIVKCYFRTYHCRRSYLQDLLNHVTVRHKLHFAAYVYLFHPYVGFIMTENTVLGAWIQRDLAFLFYLLTNVTVPKNHKLWHRDKFQNTCVCLTNTNVKVINQHTLCYLASIWSWLSWFETVANKLPRSRSLTRTLWRRLTAVNRPNGTETEKMVAIDVPLPHSGWATFCRWYSIIQFCEWK